MIFQGDAIIKAAIELGIEDMKKNLFLIDDMLSDFTTNPYLKKVYGQKQVDACKEWLLNNKIDVYLRPRDDRDILPCVTIELGNSQEKEGMKHMGDQSTETVVLLPNQIGKPIPFIIKPFTPIGYDSVTGELNIDSSINLNKVSPGMLVVNPENGYGYIIIGLTENGLQLETGLKIEASKLAVVPQYQYYVARVEHSFFEENYNIGVHAHGDAQNVMFLWSIVKYSILRYRESLLEANGFAESNISSGGPELNEVWSSPGGEKVYTRNISLTGQIENSWIKSPKRVLESIVFAPVQANSPEGSSISSFSGSNFNVAGSAPVQNVMPAQPNTPQTIPITNQNEYVGGIKIISNLDTDSLLIDENEENWTTVKE